MKQRNYKIKLKQKIELWNEYHNPFYVWWKYRKYFKFPNIKTHIRKLTWFFGFPIRVDDTEELFEEVKRLQRKEYGSSI